MSCPTSRASCWLRATRPRCWVTATWIASVMGVSAGSQRCSSTNRRDRSHPAWARRAMQLDRRGGKRRWWHVHSDKRPIFLGPSEPSGPAYNTGYSVALSQPRFAYSAYPVACTDFRATANNHEGNEGAISSATLSPDAESVSGVDCWQAMSAFKSLAPARMRSSWS